MDVERRASTDHLLTHSFLDSAGDIQAALKAISQLAVATKKGFWPYLTWNDPIWSGLVWPDSIQPELTWQDASWPDIPYLAVAFILPGGSLILRTFVLIRLWEIGRVAKQSAQKLSISQPYHILVTNFAQSHKRKLVVSHLPSAGGIASFDKTTPILNFFPAFYYCRSCNMTCELNISNCRTDGEYMFLLYTVGEYLLRVLVL